MSEKEAQPVADVIKKKKPKTFPFSSRGYDEKATMKAITQPTRRHAYFGYVFSASSKRAPTWLNGYFLPSVSQPPPRHHVSMMVPPVPKEKILRGSGQALASTPLSTLKIQWPGGKNDTRYQLEDLYNVFSRFGPVEAVTPVTPNSALVVFSRIATAAKVVTVTGLGGPWSRLVATWVDPRLNHRPFLRLAARQEEDRLFPAEGNYA